MNEIEALAGRIQKLEDECSRLRRGRRNAMIGLVLVVGTAVSVGASQNQDNSTLYTQSLVIVDKENRVRARFGYSESSGTTLVIVDKNSIPAAVLGHDDINGPSLRLSNSDLSSLVEMDIGPDGRYPAIRAITKRQGAQKPIFSMALLSSKDGCPSLKLSSGHSAVSEWMAATTDEGKPFTSLRFRDKSVLDLFVDPFTNDPVIWLRNMAGKTLIEIPEPPNFLLDPSPVFVSNDANSTRKVATRTVETPFRPRIERRVIPGKKDEKR